MASLGAWLRLVRVHTASLTMAGAVVGGLLAGGSPGMLALLAGWALLYHAAGFALNNVADYKADLKDPAKTHFPLVTGEISLDAARVFVLVGIAASILGGWAIAFHSLSFWPATVFLMVAHVAGINYNLQSKKALHAPGWICLAFGSIPAYAYLAAGGPNEPGLWSLLVLYALGIMAFQISVSGDLKDLRTDPVSRMGRLGARVETRPHTVTFTISGTGPEAATSFTVPSLGTEETLILPRAARLYAWGLRVPTLLLAAIIAWQAGSGLLAGLAVAVLAGATVWETRRLLTPGPYDHPALLKRVTRIEALVYFTLVFALQGAVGWGWVGFLLIFPVAWLLVFNKATWNQWSAPKV